MDSNLNRAANEVSKGPAGTSPSGKRSVRRLSTRDLVYIAVLAALWATSENVIGAQLHAMNIPFNGVPLTAIAIFLMVTGRSLVPKAGSTILMGIVVALLRILSIGGVMLSPMIAIFMESLLMELTMTAGGVSQLTSAIGGTLALIWSLVHPIVIQPLFFGSQIAVMYMKTILAGSKMLGVDSANVILIILVLVILHGVVGAIAGVVGWRFSLRAKRVLTR